MNATRTGTELPPVDFEKESYDLGGGWILNLPMVGLEPTQSCLRWILNPLRLPVSPHRRFDCKERSVVYFDVFAFSTSDNLSDLVFDFSSILNHFFVLLYKPSAKMERLIDKCRL